MNRRENFLAALTGRRPERLPVFFVADSFNLPEPLPPALREHCFEAGLMRFLGSDVVCRTGGTPAARVTPGVSESWVDLPEGTRSCTRHTPWGVLTSKHQVSEGAETEFLVEPLLKNAADYRIATALFKHTRVELKSSQIEGMRAVLTDAGEDGIAYMTGPSTPIMDLARTWVGLERFLYDLLDEPEMVEELMEQWHQVNCSEYEILAAHSPGEVIVLWDDLNNLYLSRDLAKRYWVPAIRDYARICHRYGKTFVLHTCGKLAGLLDLIPEAEVDAVDWLTPAPTGDTSFASAQKVFDNCVTVMGAADPSIMRFGTADEVERAIQQWMEGVDSLKRFVLMLPCPNGTPLRNAARAAKVMARDYGLPLNTHPDYWPIWEDSAAEW